MFKNYLARVLARAIFDAGLDGFALREIGNEKELQESLESASLTLAEFEKLLSLFEMRLERGSLATEYLSIKFCKEC